MQHQHFGIGRQSIQPQNQLQPQQPQQLHAQPTSPQLQSQPQLINTLKETITIDRQPMPSQQQSDVQTSVAALSTKWGLRSTPRRSVEQQVPHPELTTSQRQHLRQAQAANPVRPFLTRGSVAERVLIFERCPSDLLLDKRVRAPVPYHSSKPQVSVEFHCCYPFIKCYYYPSILLGTPKNRKLQNLALTMFYLKENHYNFKTLCNC